MFYYFIVIGFFNWARQGVMYPVYTIVFFGVKLILITIFRTFDGRTEINYNYNQVSTVQ